MHLLAGRVRGAWGKDARHEITSSVSAQRGRDGGGGRGARRIVQPGLINRAARWGLATARGEFSYAGPWRLHSWARCALPRPYSLSTCVTTEPIRVPEDADKEGLEWYRLSVEDAL